MKIKTYIIATILSLLALGAALVFSNVSNAQLSGGGGTIGQLEQWRSLGGYLVPRDANLGLKVPGLATSTTGCLSVASGGIISANGSACGSGSGSGFSTTSANYWKDYVSTLPGLVSFGSSTATTTALGNLTAIGYVQLGTTTTAMLNRTVVVDGVTYPRTRAGIQAAIDSLPLNGGTVLLPEGRYYLDGTINIKKHGVTLKGEAFVSTFADQANQQGSLYGASVLLAATTTDFVASTFPAGQPLIKVGELGTSKMWTGGGVYNLVLEGTRGVTVAGNGIEIYNVQAFRVENNGITQVAKGVHVEADQAGGISNVQIEKNIIYYNDGIGIFFGPGSQEVYARNNYISVATGYGIYTGDGSVTITGNHIESMVASSTLTYGGTAIYLTASKAYVNDNDIMNAKYHCLYIGASHEKVTDNYFNNCNEDNNSDGSGIFISGTLTDVNISGNSIHDYDSKMRYGIYDNTSGAPTVGLNTITGATVAKVYSPNNLQADNYLLSKLGVGTTSPTSQLSVVSTGNAVAVTAPTNSIYYAGYTGALKYFHILLKNSDHIELQSFEGKDITIQEQGNKVAIGGTTRNNTLTVNGTADVTGKFGIGTTSPYAALSVVGSTGVVAEKYTATGTAATSTFAGGFKLSSLNCSGLSNGGALTVNSSGEVVCTADDSGAGGTNYWANSGSDVFINTGTSASAPIFNATSTTGTSTFAGGLTVETNGLVYDYTTNNVGIGTAAPAVPLHIYNAASAPYLRIQGASDGDNVGALELWNSDASKKWQFAHQATGNFTFAHYSGGWASPLTIEDDNDILIGSNSLNFNAGGTTGSNYKFAQDGDDLMTLQRSGGTDTNYSLLQIKAPTANPTEATLALMTDAGSGNYRFADFYNQQYPTERQWGLRQRYSGTYAATPFMIDFYNGTVKDPMLAIMPSGNVGIGVSTSTLGSSGAAFLVGSTTAPAVFNGNVGIGTTSPYAKLSVVGGVVAEKYTATGTASSTFAGPVQASAFGVAGAWFTNATQFVLNTIAATFNAGATILSFLDIPSAADPTVDAEGEIAINTTTASSSLRYHDGTAERGLYPERDKTLIVSSSTLLAVGGSASATTTLMLNRPSRGETYVSFYCTTNTGTWGFQIGDGTASSTYSSCTTSGVSVLAPSNVTFTLREKEFIAIGPPSANNTVATLVLTVRPDAD